MVKQNLRAHLSMLAATLLFGVNYWIAKGLMPNHLLPMQIIFLRVLGTLLIAWIDPRLGIGHLYALEALGLGGEVQPHGDPEHLLAGHAFPLFLHPTSHFPDEEINGNEGHKHQDNEQGSHGITPREWVF